MSGAVSQVRQARRWRRDRALLVWVMLLVVGIVAGLVAWGFQLREGLAATNMRNLSMWGLYVALFMYFVGLSGGGLMLASSAGLLGIERLRPVTRLALLQATVALVVAMPFLLVDIGRPERLWNMFVHPNLSSPMVWDLIIVMVCLVVCVVSLWAHARRPAAGASAAASERSERLRWILAAVGLPAAMLVIAVDAWIFGLQNSRAFWYSAVMAPLFICSGLVSATALLLVVVLATRRRRRITVGDDIVAFLAKLLAVFIAVEAFLVFCELLTAAYPGAGSEAGPVARLLTGRLSPLFWFEIALGLVVPAVLLAAPRWRTRMSHVVVASALALVGLFAHRLIIVINGLSQATVDLDPGVPIGTVQPPGTGSFALNLFYYPSLVEWLVALGLVCLGMLVFTILMPMVLPRRTE